jgi:hypothetical protein
MDGLLLDAKAAQEDEGLSVPDSVLQNLLLKASYNLISDHEQ